MPKPTENPDPNHSSSLWVLIFASLHPFSISSFCIRCIDRSRTFSIDFRMIPERSISSYAPPLLCFLFSLALFFLHELWYLKAASEFNTFLMIIYAFRISLIRNFSLWEKYLFIYINELGYTINKNFHGIDRSKNIHVLKCFDLSNCNRVCKLIFTIWMHTCISGNENSINLNKIR